MKKKGVAPRIPSDLKRHLVSQGTFFRVDSFDELSLPLNYIMLSRGVGGGGGEGVGGALAP